MTETLDLDFIAWLAERNVALEKLDMDYARRTMPGASCDEVRLIALHKARYECTAMLDALRQESRAWLEARGYKRAHGFEWPPKGEPPC